jgi:hypothetical protein
MNAPFRQLSVMEVPCPWRLRNAKSTAFTSWHCEAVLYWEKRAAGFVKPFENLLSTGATKIVVSLERTTDVDSAGLGALIEVHRKTKAKGARLKLSNLGRIFILENPPMNRCFRQIHLARCNAAFL